MSFHPELARGLDQEVASAANFDRPVTAMAAPFATGCPRSLRLYSGHVPHVSIARALRAATDGASCSAGRGRELARYSGPSPPQVRGFFSSRAFWFAAALELSLMRGQCNLKKRDAGLVRHPQCLRCTLAFRPAIPRATTRAKMKAAYFMKNAGPR